MMWKTTTIFNLTRLNVVLLSFYNHSINREINKKFHFIFHNINYQHGWVKSNLMERIMAKHWLLQVLFYCLLLVNSCS